MDIFLNKITQHAMSYAIRSGIGITASYAIRQTSRLLKTVDNNADYQELYDSQRRLDGKIRILSPAIDMIELISARGNTTLESAVVLTKALRWDIQSLGVRLAKAANAEELSRRSKSTSKTRDAHEMEIRLIVIDIKKLLTRIDDAVPLINLAITTSGARLTTSLPATVSPSRLLQASTFLTAGDTQYSINPEATVQVGPTFILSLYMLFSGHTSRAQEDPDGVRNMTWKEAIHKARVKLIRAPLHKSESLSNFHHLEAEADKSLNHQMLASKSKANEFAYHIDIVEDFNDGLAHSFDEDDPQPGLYDDVPFAGIRDIIPIHQISKIFYADTGKILDLGGQEETNNPVLLLKRDINAPPPRRMMDENEQDDVEYHEHDTESASDPQHSDNDDNAHLALEQQIRRESSTPVSHRDPDFLSETPPVSEPQWRFPPNLDPEWLALEVYTEQDDSSSEEEVDPTEDSAYASHRPTISGQDLSESNLATNFSNLKLDSSPALQPPLLPRYNSSRTPTSINPPSPSKASLFGPIRSSLSLLEMLIRLTALQEFQQASHLSIPDELLTFFLEESSTTGAGGDGEQRRHMRREARRKVGFDPYDESPIKRRGEDYQYPQPEQDHNGYEGHSRSGTPYDDYDQYSDLANPRSTREQKSTPRSLRTPDRWSGNWSNKGIPDLLPYSPLSPYRQSPGREISKNRPLIKVQRDGVKSGSPLGRGMSVETDSSLGTSPGSPTLLAMKSDA